MGLPRLPEPFHRVYSPPEAPRVKARRPAKTGAYAVAGAFVAMAATAVALLASGVLGRPTGGRRAAVPGPRPATGAATEPSAAPLPVLATIPTACDILPAGTVRRLVPTADPSVDRMGVETASVCKYSPSRGSGYRALQVDARAFLPRYMHEQATSMTVWSYEAQWRLAQKDVTADTSSLRRIGGLGDAAFERYWIDRDVRIAVGEATVRYRNVILRVQYTEEQPAAGDRLASEQRCLADAISAARDGLASLH